MSCQAWGSKCKESGRLIESLKKDVITSHVDDNTVVCTSVQTVKLCAQDSLTVVKAKITLDSHADTCIVGDHCLEVHDHNRPVNVFGYDCKAGSKHACVVDVL